MPDHHLVRRAEKGGSCIYCSRQLEDAWISEFFAAAHYKCVLCTCGKQNCVKVDYIGTGHDAWSGLETKIKGNSKIIAIENKTRILR